jgi:hypothetical protein
VTPPSDVTVATVDGVEDACAGIAAQRGENVEVRRRSGESHRTVSTASEPFPIDAPLDCLACPDETRAAGGARSVARMVGSCELASIGVVRLTTTTTMTKLTITATDAMA